MSPATGVEVRRGSATLNRWRVWSKNVSPRLPETAKMATLKSSMNG